MLRTYAAASLLLLLGLPLTAAAVPMTLNHQGRLADAGGDALDGSYTLRFSLYDSASATAAVWSESQSTELTNGYFSATLGASTPLESSLFAGGALWLGLAIDSGDELGGRVQVHSVPFAIHAGNVRGGVVDASEVRVNGNVVINSAGQINTTALPAASDTLADLECTSDQIAAFNGSTWSCADTSAHTHDAGDITTGRLDINRLPVGNSDGTVAAGAHTHDAGDITTGRLDNGRLPTDVALEGTLRVGTSGAACTAANAGQVRQAADGRLNLCISNTWTPIALANRGHAAANPGLSCLDILESGSDKGDGVYWIRPQGVVAAYEAYCDMTTAGGGWTLLLKANASRTILHYDDPLWTNTALLNPTELNTSAGNAKFPAYNNMPFSTLRGCFPTQGNTCITKEWASYRTGVATFSGAADVVDGHPGFNPAWSTQPNCKKFGVNTPHQYIRARFGFTANQENDCGTNDTGVGFGVGPLNIANADYHWGAGQICLSTLCSNGNKNESFPGYLWAR